jgi:hypothetical protein
MSETGGPEHDFEPVRGLPARLPQGERIVWQGAPDARVVLRRLLRARLVAAGFALMALWSVALGLEAGENAVKLIARIAFAAAGAAIVMGMLWLYARAVARTSLYTVTNRRIVMRIGVAISASFNLPFTQVVEAGFREADDGTGDIALSLSAGHGLSSAVFFPHQKGAIWRKLEPQLICLGDVRTAAAILAAQIQAHAAAAAPLDDLASDAPQANPAAGTAGKRPAGQAPDQHRMRASHPAGRLQPAR